MKDMNNGLYSKYIVIKADGSPLDGDCFVLRPDRDTAAFAALERYAEKTKNRALADDIYRWLNSIRETDSAKDWIGTTQVGKDGANG